MRVHGTAAASLEIAGVAGLAILDARISLATRWFSARIRKGAHRRPAQPAFEHVQRCRRVSTRTQTGALVSPLNNDAIGAQQAFSSTLSGRARRT